MTPEQDRYRQLLLDQIDAVEDRIKRNHRTVKEELQTINQRIVANQASCEKVGELQEGMHADQRKLLQLQADLRDLGVGVILTIKKQLEEE